MGDEKRLRDNRGAIFEGKLCKLSILEGVHNCGHILELIH